MGRKAKQCKRYEILYIDPPWEYKDKNANGKRGAGFKYKVLKPKDIIALPIQNVAAVDCALFLWTTGPMLPMAIYAIRQWGFEYKTLAFDWVKLNKYVQNSISLLKDDMFIHKWEYLEAITKFSLGHWTRSSVELCLLATKGKPKRVDKSVRQTVFYPGYPVLEHSAKPPVVRDKIVKLMGDIPRLEMFAREKTPGWDATGLEVDGVDVRDFLTRGI
jgi:N6-adenosine-specific RNA methylase IME4